MPAPPKGEITRQQAFRLIADLKQSADAKSGCGRRVLAWYADVAKGFAQ